MSSELKDALKKRLDENYANYIESLQGKTISELISMAPEITAAKQCHEELLGACDEDDVAFLLQFSDPLEVVRGYWESELSGYDHSNEMGHMIWEIRDRELYSKDQLAQSMQGEKSEGKENVFMSDKPIPQITTDDLRKMSDQEGLVLQGCGGDPQEWVDGINDLLTEANILLDGSKFENVSTFQHGSLTNLLFPFENDVKLDMGKLAMWRLQTHEQFGSTWLSDYVPNRLGGFKKEQVPQKPKMELLGQDNNIFSIMGRASFLLQMAGMNAENKEMVDRVTSCEDYDKALSIISEYVETELSPPSKKPQKSKNKEKRSHER